MSLKILEDEATREGIARILLEEIEKKGVVKELADRDPNQLHEDMSSTVMDALRMMMEEIKKTREELKEEHKEMAEGIAKGMKSLIRGQMEVADAVIDVVRQEGQYTREKINEAQKEMNEKISDHFYYANKLHP